MDRPRIGLVTCVHPVYDLPEVLKHRDRAIAGLEKENCEIVAAEIPRDSLDSLEIAKVLKKAEVDLVLLFFCTWVAEEITLALAKELIDLPLLLWALPYLDRETPVPSPMTGLTTSGCNIRRLGKPYVYMIGSVTKDRIQEAHRTAKVAATLMKLRRARFGLVGSPCPGMIDAGCDEALMQRSLGITAVHLDLNALWKAAESASAEESSRLAQDLLAKTGGTEQLSPDKVADHYRLYLGMKALVEKHKLDAFCVRCWPELRDQYRTTICLTLSHMADAGIPSVCEVDLPALITAYVLNRLAGSPAYCFDITGYLEEEGALQLAHCGSAALSLAEDPKKAKIRGHMRTGAGAMLEFGFKRGTVTLAKLLRPIHDRAKLFAARGEAIHTGGEIRGSVATVKVEPSPAAFIGKMLREGVEHHPVMVYGDLIQELTQFCELSDIELLTP
jgi:L-fucose isomerase-like protein